MASESNIHKRRVELLNLLSSANEYSIDKLASILSIKKRTLMSDVAHLRNQNYEIIIKNGIISLHSDTLILPNLQPSSKAILRRSVILLTLQNTFSGHCETNQLVHHLVQKIANTYIWDEKTKDSKRRLYLYDIEQLISEGYLIKDLHGNLQSSLKTPILLYLDEKDSEQKLIQIRNTNYGTSLAPIIDSIFYKLGKNLSYKLFTDTVISAISHQTFGESRYSDLITAIQKLESCNFKKYQSHVKYRTNTNEIQTMLFSVGMIVYSMEKSKLYLLGSLSDSKRKIILNAEHILDIFDSAEHNLSFESNEYKQIYDEMFFISIEEPHKVKIVFHNHNQIIPKLRRLCQTRTTASLTPYKSGYLYEDTIRGMNDFARYLRSFGSSCTVLTPDILKEKMVMSAKKICERYEFYAHKSKKEKINEELISNLKVPASDFRNSNDFSRPIGTHSVYERIFSLITLLNESPDGISVEQILEYLNAPLQIIIEDLINLEHCLEMHQYYLSCLNECWDSFHFSELYKTLTKKQLLSVILSLEPTQESPSTLLTPLEFHIYKKIIHNDKQTKLFPTIHFKKLYPDSTEETIHFQDVLCEQIRKGNQEVTIRYEDQTGTRMNLSILPLQLVYVLGNNLSYIYCYSLFGYHYLRIDRIRKIISTKPSLNIDKTKYWEKEALFHWSVDGTADSYPIKLLIFKEANVPFRIQTELCHRSNGMWTECKDYWIYEDVISSTTSIEQWLRQYGSSVLVLEPPKIAKNLYQSARIKCSQYPKIHDTE